MYSENVKVSLEYAEAVARALGAGWTATAEEYGGKVLTDGSTTIRVHGSLEGKGRIQASGARPKGSNGVYEAPDNRGLTDRITVAADCPAERCAREIARRLLPDWTRRSTALAAEVAQTLAHQERVLQEASEVVQIVNGELPTIRPGSDLSELRIYGGGKVFRVYGNGTVAIERFECPVEKLAAVLAAAA